jgi:uncharacterized protein YeaO (DUF488 family)
MIRVVRLGIPRARGEGLRLGTVRLLPRGVNKEDFAKRDYSIGCYCENALRCHRSVLGELLQDRGATIA